MEETALFLQTAVQLGTPLLLATIGGILSEKAGHLNLGIEGMMLMGAVMSFFVGIHTGNPLLAVLVAGLAGAFGALLYGIVTITFQGNQIVAGLALTIFGTGFANFIGKSVSEMSLPASVTDPLSTISIPVLSSIPLIGKALFEQSIIVMLGLVVAILAYLYLKKTRFGLALRAVGENPAAADASGVPVTLYKYVHVLAGGFLCGIGASYLSLVFVPRWQDNLTSGQGWIAVVLIIFATWNPARAIFGAYFFGALRSIGFKLQGVKLMGISFSSHILDMVPYVVTILVLVFITMRKKPEDQPPLSLGTAYFREDR